MENFLSYRILSLLRCCMLKIVFFLTLCLISDAAFCQNTDQNKVTQIRQQMAKIRQTTNWDNPAEAKAANEQIKVLMGQLVAATSASSNGQSSAGGQNQGGSENSNSDGNKMSELQMEMSKHKVDVYTQLWEAGASGKSAPVLLAKPLREEIIQEFKDEDDKTVKNQEFLDKMTVLTLEMSMPGIDLIIDAMSAYKGIKTLIITTKEITLNVDLVNIFKQAKDYPLEELCIFNLGVGVTTIPAEIRYFKNVHTISLLANNIKSLPKEVSGLKELKYLYVDHNPLGSIEEVVSPITGLQELGIAKTKIQLVEIDHIRKVLPNCKILTE